MVDAGPLGTLPSLSRRQVQLGRKLGRDGSRLKPGRLLGALAEVFGGTIEVSRFTVEWRAAGLRRPGAIAQLSWPRLGMRIGLGIEPTLAHVVVDRLLGYDRLPAEGRLQVTPVEWGILTYVLARGLDRLDREPGPLGPWDLTLDRVGPDPFDVLGLGPIVTWRWRVTVGDVQGVARLWIPETLLALWLLDDPEPSTDGPTPVEGYGDLTGRWTASYGEVTLERGLSRLTPGALLLIDGTPLTGTPSRPEGLITFVLDDHTWRSTFRARSADGRLVVASPLTREPLPRGTPPMADPAHAPTNAGVASAEIPVTLTVELGRVNLPLHRLADHEPGDVLELGRQAREPVDLTSGGRLIARGELVQVDTELGVRVTHVYL